MQKIHIMLSDSKGVLSYKRCLGAFGMLSLTASLILTSFKVGVKPPKEIIEAIEYITIASVFGVTAERFTKSK